ncbi:MAG: tRNA glutamyl-Q(34) synthetase GluQRS [Deltaproteobacteria bacterium]|nr:tRNA glutamyl-Q(34) synthetase GluQRS [Deltaproteobacteria bacterium]
MNAPIRNYVGRYAPSPTGDLHIGNVFAAVVAWSRARRQHGRCLLRIEDLDTPRVKAGATERIRADLETLGLSFDDDDVIVQSARTRAYEEALRLLVDDGLVYACSCSRKDLAASAPHAGDEGPRYAGTCRDKGIDLASPNVSLRVRVDRLVQKFGDPIVDDAWQGRFSHDVEGEVGDFIVKRRDGLFAYQLAVVVDDACSGVTEVVRGQDLLSSAPRQVLLHRALGNESPAFAHLPLIVDDEGHRLSKRSGNAPELLRSLLERVPPVRVLGHLLHLLGCAADDAAVDAVEFAALLDESALARPVIVWRDIA